MNISGNSNITENSGNINGNALTQTLHSEIPSTINEGATTNSAAVSNVSAEVNASAANFWHLCAASQEETQSNAPSDTTDFTFLSEHFDSTLMNDYYSFGSIPSENRSQGNRNDSLTDEQLLYPSTVLSSFATHYQNISSAPISGNSLYMRKRFKCNNGKMQPNIIKYRRLSVFALYRLKLPQYFAGFLLPPQTQLEELWVSAIVHGLTPSWRNANTRWIASQKEALTEAVAKQNAKIFIIIRN